jgi:hypothetical protein
MSDYNGWTNWETWNLYTWLSNDESTYYHARKAKSKMNLQDFVADWWTVQNASPVMDAWNAYLHVVDWEELVQAFQPEIGEDDE